MTPRLDPRLAARIDAVYLAEGELARACQTYAIAREYFGDHVFKRVMLAYCLRYGLALNEKVR